MNSSVFEIAFEYYTSYACILTLNQCFVITNVRNVFSFVQEGIFGTRHNHGNLAEQNAASVGQMPVNTPHYPGPHHPGFYTNPSGQPSISGNVNPVAAANMSLPHGMTPAGPGGANVNTNVNPNPANVHNMMYQQYQQFANTTPNIGQQIDK